MFHTCMSGAIWFQQESFEWISVVEQSIIWINLRLMSAYDIILVVVSGLGVIHGIFLALFLWGYRKGNSLSNKLLSALLVVLSLRVGKSVFLEFTDSVDIKIIFAGLSTIMAIGPLYFLFALSCTRKAFRLTTMHAIHFIPAILGFIIGLLLEERHTVTLPFALFATLFIVYYPILLFICCLVIGMSFNKKRLVLVWIPLLYCACSFMDCSLFG